MARKQIPEHQKLRDVPAKILPETIEILRQIADKHEWSMSKTVRKAIEKGLETWVSDLNGDQCQAELLSVNE